MSNDTEAQELKQLRTQFEQLQKEHSNLQDALQAVLAHSLELESRLLDQQQDLVGQVSDYQEELEEKRALLLMVMENLQEENSAGIELETIEEATPSPLALSVLTPRQHEILSSIAEGRSNKQIAHHLTLSEGTIKQHVRQIFRVLQVRNRVEAIAKARELGEL